MDLWASPDSPFFEKELTISEFLLSTTDNEKSDSFPLLLMELLRMGNTIQYYNNERQIIT